MDTRRLALVALESVHSKAGGTTSLSRFETGMGSSAASVYLDMQYQLSQVLAHQHPSEAMNVVIQCALNLPQTHDLLASHAFPYILHALSPWLKLVNLLVVDNSSLSREGCIILYHLLSLTFHYSDICPEQVQLLWNCLVDDNPSNGHATIRFLLENSSKVGSIGYVTCARKIVACLSRTSFGRQTFEELCEVVEPARMLPTIDHKLMFPNAEETDLWSDLDALFAEQPKLSLGVGQFALLFLGDIALPQAWEFRKQLPVMLHGIFTHIGHRNPFIRDQARRLFFQTLRAWLPGYDDLIDSGSHPSYAMLKSALTELEKDTAAIFWTEDDSIAQIGDKIHHLCSIVMKWLEPLDPNLADEWGSLALLWGTTCSIRPIAFRSLQVYRGLMPAPTVTRSDIAQLLGRLSNTVAAQETSLHPFTAELILTLISIAKSEALDPDLLPQVFWCTVACLSTPVELEFLQLLDLLECLLDRLDLDDYYTIEVLVANKPPDFVDAAPGLQPLLLVGLRSSSTCNRTLQVLNRFAKMENSTLLDSSGNRLRDMYTLVLPWCLRLMEENKTDSLITSYAENISRLAELEECHSIARIMTSFIKSRFRTKDDFTRQAAAALREHYAPYNWTEVVTLLMSLVLNRERWLQMKSMQFLKVLFQLRETRNPVDRLGSELLMPLLRLLQTDLASQALEVLEEPMSISGGLAARHVLRMSMHVGTAPTSDDGTVTEVFGMPEESGWSIARPHKQRETCRANVMAVFDTCKMASRPSKIDFEPEVDRFADPLETDLGDLVQNLHELSTFFLDDTEAGQLRMKGKQNPTPIPNQRLEARVAAILAKSTDASSTFDTPQTPFVDVFNVNATNAPQHILEESDEDSDSSEFDIDTFAFESHPSMSSDAGHQNGYFERHW